MKNHQGLNKRQKLILPGAIQRSVMKITMEAWAILEEIPKDKITGKKTRKTVSTLLARMPYTSPSFKLLDKNQVVLRAPRQNGVYSLDLKNIVPSGDLVRCDHGTEFKNHDMNELCAKKGIKKKFSVARTPQQNGVAERKNRTLIEATRNMLADSLLPIPFWAEAVNTACYPLGKFDRKSDEGYLLGYSTTSKAFRVYNKRTKRVEENMHIDFLEDQPNVAGSGPDWMFDLDFLTNTMNYVPVSVENQVNVDAVEDVVQAAQEKPSKNSPKDNDVQDSEDAADKEEQDMLTEPEQVLQDDLERMIAQECAAKAINDATRQAFEEEKRGQLRLPVLTNLILVGHLSSFVYLGGQTPIYASTLPNVDLPIDPNMPDLEDDSNIFPNDGIFSRAYDDEDVGAEADFNNMDNTIDVSPIPTLRVHKDHPKGQILGDPKLAVQTRGKIQKASLVQQALEEGIDYDEVFAPVAKIEAIRLFLAFASFMGFLVYQIDVKSAFLYGTIEEEVYVHQPLGFVDPSHPNKVYKVIKALYGLPTQGS
ncbi:putative ribonuclease H-like domain-containing protein [Tanacetum coccineum]